MGKRSNFPRIDKDKYNTPKSAVLPLLPFLPTGTLFAEPCAGAGALIDILEGEGHVCMQASDIAPERKGIETKNALDLDWNYIDADVVITNPPWTRALMHLIIECLSEKRVCWFLFDADWMHTKQSSELIKRCSRIVSVGRVKWMPDSPHVGKDNCCWYEFAPRHIIGPKFIGRQSG
jgi:hypothetical protein